MAETQVIEQKLKEVLDKAGVKYDASKVKWAITSDDAGLTTAINQKTGPKALLRTTRIIFLEQGNDCAGLQHIYKRHAKDFKNKADINCAEGISKYIEKVMKEYDPSDVKSSKRGGIHVIYKITNDNSYYLHMGIGSNGFIVTAYPSSKP